VSIHHKINYIEFPSKDIELTKQFFAEVFDWQFVDYGPDYCAITGGGIDAGFYLEDMSMSQGSGSALIVLFSEELENTEAKVRLAGGTISKPIFSFPGGRRFHFLDLNGSEFAVWSDK